MRTLYEIEKGMNSDNQDDWVTFDEIKWLIDQAKRADRYEDLALRHQYEAILDEMDKE